MRLYLSSFRMGDHPERLLELLGSGRRAAVIANAIDDADAETRKEGVEREVEALRALGLEPRELDLREHFGSAPDLGGYDLIWLRGGNVFLLRYALAASGADTLLVDLLHDDALVYAGYSAGPCVLGPSLRGLELVDEPEAVDATYGAEPVWDGLGLLDFAIVPHVDSPDHPETERCNRLAEHYRVEGVPHRTLRDGEVLVID
ncbi:MAG TPA: Type 1 glutamine amidotransferase-like domain-containing protein [Gaiellaceae bacterium]|jgi:dipeptidase E|nr:Type 1 glutamine amidotransferase-like domain-containing protein [Gaiellaceae bacterium]